MKNVCFAFQRQFSKLFQVFPRLFIHCLPYFSLNRNWPKHSSNSISASFLLQSSRKRYGFSLSHFIFHVLSLLFLILLVCCCHYVLKSIMLIQGFALSWWVFIVWELVFLTLLLVFIWSLWSVLYFMIVLFHSYHVCGILSHYLSFESCNAYCPLDSELLMFIIIFDCLFHLLCPCSLWLLVFNLVLVSVIEWNLPVSHSYTWL